MGVYFVLLAYGATLDESVDICGKSWPPEVMFKECFGAESACVAKGGGVV